MSRLAWILLALVGVLVVVLWWFLLWSPTSEEIELTEAETEQVLVQAQQQRQRAAQLRQVRERAPEAEAQLALARTLIPQDVGIPALLRLLQTAADDAGVRLNSISPSAPSPTEIGEATVEVVGVSMAIEGTYFQIIDFARRIEDPAITGRALLWNSANLSPSDYPTLSVTLSGQVFSRDRVVLAPAPEPDPAADDPGDGPVDTDTDDEPSIDDDEEVVS